MNGSFRGGVHPPDMKSLSRDLPLQEFLAKGDMVFPLSQHIGKPAKAVVKKNDPVLAGQLIAEADGFVSANVYSSCSGKVKAVEKHRTISGQMLECIIIENDGEYTQADTYDTRRDVDGMTVEEITAAVKDAGIVGLGGAGFPTHVKLMPKDSAAIRYVIVNGAECEPYITCNDQLMRSNADEIVEGTAIVLELFPNAEAVIAIEDNKPEAVAAMQQAVTKARNARISVRALHTKYPQGGERSLITAIAGIDFPVASLPADVGCIVDNVGTVYAIQRAVVYGEPLFKHVMTLTGEAVSHPGNYIIRDGTCVAELVEASGGISDQLKKVLAGGPMMGFALTSLDVPVVKTTNAITMLAADPVEEAEKEMTACLHCGRCTTVCPQGLLPQMMADASEINDLDRYENKLYGLDCIACGSCTYICPAKRPLTQIFKQTKAEILAIKRAAAGGK